MIASTFWMDSVSRGKVYVNVWEPETSIRAAVQISHGMAETGNRYKRFAEALTAAGYVVYANDHLGHGQTAPNDTELGHLSKHGMMNMVSDMERLTLYIRDRHPGVPLILFGHSMGSFLTQMYISQHGKLLDGAVLCASNGPRGPELLAGIAVSRLIAGMRGWKHRSTFINNLTFGGFNRRFDPHKTEFDWLSRDEAEVQKYVDNPHCGYVCTVGFYHEFFKLLNRIHQSDVMSSIPKDLPVLMIAGTEDPVSNFNKGVPRLADMYRELNINDVTLITYPGARHELLNETNRDEVTSDCLAWMDRVLK
ncbi:alpha/beta hydrolase [Paenibacillus marinisediminis]